MFWKDWKFHQRLTFLRWFLPSTVLLTVVAYQTLLFPWIHHEVGIFYHSILEIVFYGVLGAVFLYWALDWASKGFAKMEQTERLVRKKDHLLASITESSAEAIIGLNREWRIQSWNRGAATMFGHTEGDVVGSSCLKLLGPGNATQQFDEIRSTLQEQGYLLDHEITLVQRGDHPFPAEMTITALGEENEGYSVVIRDVSLRKQRERVLSQERKRIAGEIHDSFAQDLFSMTLKLDLCQKLIRQNKLDVLEQELELIRAVMKQGLKDVRRAIYALQPVELEELSFGSAVRQLTERFEQIYSLPVKLTVQNEHRPLPQRLETVLFRTLQECLNNVAKHSQARHVWVEVDLCADDGIVLAVKDDGQGFLPQSVNPHTHLGLVHLKDQAQRLGGQFSLDSRMGQGTTIEVRVPHHRPCREYA